MYHKDQSVTYADEAGERYGGTIERRTSCSYIVRDVNGVHWSFDKITLKCDNRNCKFSLVTAGELVQGPCQYYHEHNWYPATSIAISFDGGSYILNMDGKLAGWDPFLVKPAKYRPFTVAECIELLGLTVKDAEGKFYIVHNVTAFSASHSIKLIGTGYEELVMTRHKLLDSGFTYNSHPCGKADVT